VKKHDSERHERKDSSMIGIHNLKKIISNENKNYDVVHNLNIVKKNPLIKHDQKLETHLPRNTLSELKKMSEKIYLKEVEEDKPRRDRKTVKFNEKDPDGLVERGEEPFKKINDEKIQIDNEIFFKNDIDLISKKVLIRCNFIHPKSKNNNKELRIGDGKLMMTNGLSVSEFVQRYHLK